MDIIAKMKINNLKDEQDSLEKETQYPKKVSFSKMFWISVIFVSLQILITISVFRKRSLFKEFGLSENFHELLIVIPGYLISMFIYKILSSVFSPIIEKLLTPETIRENETPDERIKRVINYLASFFYYFVSFSVSFYVTYKEGVLPKSFGGSFDFIENLSSWPDKSNFSIKVIHLLNYGHHLERLIDLLVNDFNNPTFYVMFLHHTLTVGLIAFSYHAGHYIVALPASCRTCRAAARAPPRARTSAPGAGPGRGR